MQKIFTIFNKNIFTKSIAILLFAAIIIFALIATFTMISFIFATALFFVCFAYIFSFFKKRKNTYKKRSTSEKDKDPNGKIINTEYKDLDS